MKDWGKGAALLWDWRRKTAWSRVREVMEGARITSPQAAPKGLWLAFGMSIIVGADWKQTAEGMWG